MSYQKKQFGVYHKWFMDNVDVYRDALNNEQMGRLFFAVMDYVKTGERQEVEGDVRFPYLDQCGKIDRARNDYNAKCETNAENGRKGGQAKARNSNGKDSGESAPKKAAAFQMSKKDFEDIWKKLKHDGDVEGAPADVTALYEQLKWDGWKYCGIPFSDRYQVETFLKVMFMSEECCRNYGFIVYPDNGSIRFTPKDLLMIGCQLIAQDPRFKPFKYRDIEGPDIYEFKADMGEVLNDFIDEYEDPGPLLRYSDSCWTFVLFRWDEGEGDYATKREHVYDLRKVISTWIKSVFSERQIGPEEWQTGHDAFREAEAEMEAKHNDDA